MKTILILLLVATQAFAALSSKMGSASVMYERGATTVTDGNSTLQLAANFVNGTSGTAYEVRFSSPVTQSSGAMTIYAFMTARTGSPTAIKAAVFAGPSGAMDDDRPDTGAALATSAAVDVSAQTTNTWTTFTLSGLSLTAGATYYAVIFNDTGTPASNNATYKTRAQSVSTSRFPAYTTTDGNTTDPTLVNASADAVIVMKFDDGSLLGNPYSTTTAHANNAQDRGNRYVFDATTNVVGVFNGTANANMSHIKVYQGSTELASVTLDRNQTNNGSLYIYFNSPVTFSAGVAYDVVRKYSGNSTTGSRLDAGTSPPSDVVNCMPTGIKYVDGSTPGSYTAVDGLTDLFLMIDNIPSPPTVAF